MKGENFQTFSLKFIDVMMGIVLGLGFQLWPDLQEPWQYIAFIFVYINFIDFWIDYSPTLKKFPPKKELGLMIHLLIIFTMFLLIYSTSQTITAFFLSYVVFRLADIWWLFNIHRGHKPKPEDDVFIHTWSSHASIEALGAFVLYLIVGPFLLISSFVAMLAFVVFRITARVIASLRYKKVFFE